MTRSLLPTRLMPLLVMFLALFTLIVQGCFHSSSGGGGGITPDANPEGYYINTGMASVDDGAGGTIDINDLQAMVNDNRIMMMSVANGLLYDGTITNISGNDFTADFIIYTDGKDPVTASASGTVTTGSSITGTLDGSGVGNGTFSLLYDDTASNTVANLSRIENMASANTTWMALLGIAIIEQEFSIDNGGAITHAFSGGPGIFSGCDFNGSIMPIIDSSLYDVTVTLTNCNAGGGLANGDYTGLAISRTSSSEDDTLVFAVTNDSYAPGADFI